MTQTEQTFKRVNLVPANNLGAEYLRGAFGAAHSNDGVTSLEMGLLSPEQTREFVLGTIQNAYGASNAEYAQPWFNNLDQRYAAVSANTIRALLREEVALYRITVEGPSADTQGDEAIDKILNSATRRAIDDTPFVFDDSSDRKDLHQQLARLKGSEPRIQPIIFTPVVAFTLPA